MVVCINFSSKLLISAQTCTNKTSWATLMVHVQSWAVSIHTANAYLCKTWQPSVCLCVCLCVAHKNCFSIVLFLCLVLVFCLSLVGILIPSLLWRRKKVMRRGGFPQSCFVKTSIFKSVIQIKLNRMALGCWTQCSNGQISSEKCYTTENKLSFKSWLLYLARFVFKRYLLLWKSHPLLPPWLHVSKGNTPKYRDTKIPVHSFHGQTKS